MVRKIPHSSIRLLLPQAWPLIRYSSDFFFCSVLCSFFSPFLRLYETFSVTMPDNTGILQMSISEKFASTLCARSDCHKKSPRKKFRGHLGIRAQYQCSFFSSCIQTILLVPDFCITTVTESASLSEGRGLYRQ